ncbi:MAG: deoxynucleoside kinase [Clostridia bacterium]|nr:deoxynucleoside kinase [Clostridia bacterium]
MKKKYLIVIEGACDGIGKSTQYALLTKALETAGHRVVRHHFPSYGTFQGAPVEAYLKGELGTTSELSPYLVNSFFAIDRAVTWKSELSVGDGDVLLLDRYTTSSVIYQSALIDDEAEKTDFIDYVMDFEYGKLGVPEPDLVIFLDAPFETAQKLREARHGNEGVEGDIHETDTAYMRRVWDSAQFVCRTQGWHRVCCTDGEGNMRSIDDIHGEILSCVTEKINEKL